MTPKMQTAKVRWILTKTSEVVGTSTLQVPADGEGFPNWAYFCPLCGELWARELWDLKRENGRIHWFVRTNLCPDHPKSRSNLISSTNRELVLGADIQLLTFEFNALFHALPTHMKPKEFQ